MDQSSFLNSFNDLNNSREFLKKDNSKNNNSTHSLNISNVSAIENKYYDADINEQKLDLVELEKLNKALKQDKTFKNKLKTNNNITSAKKKDEIIEKYFNNPDNMFFNEVLPEDQQEENKQDNTNSIENLTKEFLKEHKMKRLVKYNQQKRIRKIHKNDFKQKPKTANINLQEEFKNRWKWKTTIRNFQFRDFDRSDSGLMKF